MSWDQPDAIASNYNLQSRLATTMLNDWRLMKKSTLILAASERVHDELIFTSRNAALLSTPYWAMVGQSARHRSNAQGFRPATFLALSERSDGDYGFARRRQVAVMVGRGAAARGNHKNYTRNLS